MDSNDKENNIKNTRLFLSKLESFYSISGDIGLISELCDSFNPNEFCFYNGSKHYPLWDGIRDVGYTFRILKTTSDTVELSAPEKEPEVDINFRQDDYRYLIGRSTKKSSIVLEKDIKVNPKIRLVKEEYANGGEPYTYLAKRWVDSYYTRPGLYAPGGVYRKGHYERDADFQFTNSRFYLFSRVYKLKSGLEIKFQHNVIDNIPRKRFKRMINFLKSL